MSLENVSCVEGFSNKTNLEGKYKKKNQKILKIIQNKKKKKLKIIDGCADVGKKTNFAY